MSQITNLSKIDTNFIDLGSELQLSFDQGIFSNYLEPSENEVFDTRRFTIKQRNSEILKTATPKVIRNSSPARFSHKFPVRANSAKLISKCLLKSTSDHSGSQGHLVKRVENLEKKQEMWKERANVWEKERKSFKKAINTINSTSTSFYKNQLENWKNSKFLKRLSEDIENLSPLQEIKNFFVWMNSQSDDTPFKAIKLATNQFIYKVERLENNFKFNENEEKYKKVLEEISLKNENLTNSLNELEKELKLKSDGIKQLQEKINLLNEEIVLKENEVKDSMDMSNNLQFTISQLQTSEKKISEVKIFELEAEIEEKNYKIMILDTENKRLSQRNEQNEISNKVYIETIEELKEKLKNLRIQSNGQGFFQKRGTENEIETVEIKRKHLESVGNKYLFEKSRRICENNFEKAEIIELKFLKNFDNNRQLKKTNESYEKSIKSERKFGEFESVQMKNMSTQTIGLPKHHKKRSFDVCKVSRVEDFISYSACMASAIEALIDSRQ